MADVHIQEHRGLKVELARQYLWEFRIGQPIGEVMNAAFGVSGGVSPDIKQFVWRCKTTAIPDAVNEVYEHMYKSEKISFAGRDASAKTFTTTFIEAQDIMVHKYLYAWNRYCKYANKSAYAQDIQLMLLGRSNKVIAEYKMIQAWPENVAEVPLDYATNDPLEVGGTFRFDEFELIVKSPDAGGVPSVI